jgi:DNA-directed RNA polymerase specialized sigma54-like protein
MAPDGKTALAPRATAKAETRLSRRMAHALRLLSLPRGELARSLREAAEKNPAIELDEPPATHLFSRRGRGAAFPAAVPEEAAANSFLDHYRRGLAVTALLPEEKRAVAVVLSALSADGEATLSAEETAREAGVPLEAAQAALAAIADCGPPPQAAAERGGGGGESDLSISLDNDGTPSVRFAEEGIPRVSFSREVKDLLSDPDAGAEAKKYAKEKLAQAEFLQTALGLRKRTLEAVGEEIAHAQTAFFRKGPEALVPLTRREVARKLGISESTVSRAVAGKWVETPWGMKPLAYFFDNGMAPGAREKLRALVAAELPAKPLSDEVLRKALAAEGIALSRRTVAKYRLALGIPGAAERKRLRQSLADKSPRR